MVSGLGHESVEEMWVWWLGLKLVGLNRAAWVYGGDFDGFKSMAFSMAVGCCRRGCGGLG